MIKRDRICPRNTGPHGRVTAVLGPTNTGKTHLAVERMLGHRSGIIGLPLRLLAREIYDKVVAIKGERTVALITGEEKIIPPHPAYFVCTTESMPLGVETAFVAVDEVQLAADPERGHVFTDRLLHARGTEETMLLGADTMRPIIRRLVPEAEYLSRPRFSTLEYRGEKKLSRLPRRSAVVAFSAAEVYGTAELIRRQRGGAAVVMGALSPRTRNAQVELYQSGDVDFIVATDAIGMGLNMDVDHVAFGGLKKFDGARIRALSPAELGQIAGRAGRHMNDGTFGTTAKAGLLDPEVVVRLENHKFATIHTLQWRNSDLDFSGITALMASLQAAPPNKFFRRAREAMDSYTLKILAADPEIASLGKSGAALRLLWQACQIPDFRKTMADVHVRLVGDIFQRLAEGDGKLSSDWLAGHVSRLDRTDGGIDTLANRIAHVRTWNYVANQAGWLVDADHWQETIRDLEDRLSDALHAGLMQRFIDRRTTHLVKRLGQDEELLASVSSSGEVKVEGHFVGNLKGFHFLPDDTDGTEANKALHAAARQALSGEINRRAAKFAQEKDEAFGLGTGVWSGFVLWDEEPLARLISGPGPLSPGIALLTESVLEGAARHAVEVRAKRWLSDYIEDLLSPLITLNAASKPGASIEGGDSLGPAARGLAYHLVEAFGVLPREQLAAPPKALSRSERANLRRLGVRLGEHTAYLPALLRPEATRCRLLLWTVYNRAAILPTPPEPGRVSLPVNESLPDDYYRIAGFHTCGDWAVRVDMYDRLARAARTRARKGPFAAEPDMMSLVGCGGELFERIVCSLGYKVQKDGDGTAQFIAARDAEVRKLKKHKARKRKRPAKRSTSDSPFAALAALKSKKRKPGT